MIFSKINEGVRTMSQESQKCKSTQLPVTLKTRLVFIFILMLMFSFTSSAYASSTKRLAGQTRYDTAVAIAQDGWKQSDYAILAYGENYPDALSAAPLAKKFDAPILLTNGNNLPTVTKETLIKLQVKNVFIIGGTGVIPSSIDAELQLMNISVTRIAGQDRYDTAIKVAQQLPTPTEIFVVTGEDYADALSIAPVAAIKQEPIILVPKDYMPDSVKAYLNANKIDKTYVVGATDVIDNSVFNQLPNAERIIGVDKYARNINVNLKFDNLFSSKDICVATGEGFADALTGTSYAAKKIMPIVIVNSYPAFFTRTYTVVKLNMADSIKGNPFVFGGTAVVPNNVIDYLYTLPDVITLSAPANIVATAISNSEITLQWDQVSDADYYYVYYYSSDYKKYLPIISTTDYSNIQFKRLPGYSFSFTGLSANTTQDFKVTAVKNGVESNYSNVASATTLNTPVLSAPTNLVATATSSSRISIQWDQISNADYYYVYLSKDNSQFAPASNDDGSKIQYKWLPGYSFNGYNISPNTTWYYKVTAVKNGVESIYSNVASATTLSNPTPITPIPVTSGVIESSINGEFTGWTGDTIFKLLNGQIWQQASFDWTWHWAYSPKVLIYKSGSVYKMQVDGVDRIISVTRLK